MALLLVLSSMYAFGGCNQGGNDLYSGIVISQEQPHTQETEAYAETVIFSMLKSALGIEPNDKATEKMQGIAKDIQNILASAPLHDELYLKVMQKVEQEGEAVLDEVMAKGAKGLEATKAMYLDLSSMVGVDYVGGVLYDLCAYFYQYQYDQNMANYEKYGYTYLKLDAEKYQTGKQALENGIGKDNFITVLKSGFAFADLFFGGGMQSEQFSTFTDMEILLFIQGLDLSSLSLTEEGWQLVLSRGVPNEGGMYAMKLLTLLKTHDLSEGAKVLDYGTKLLSNAMNRWTEADVALLRGGDISAMIQKTFQRFDEADWALFENMTTLSIHTEQYDALAVETYGEAYLQYKNTATVFTLTELRAAVGQENFENVLRGYIAGISPAISYGMQHD